ncbi:MAG: FAD-binding oxidoreductase [Silicimonas sp.]|nr:FAD-binding oxidoreductase [Silicimonas sp.]
MRIIVIGGGIAGVSAAAALAPSAQVTLLEQEAALAYHASGRSAAMFEENYGNASVVALNRASRSIHETLGVLSPRGLLGLARPGDEAAFDADLIALGLTEIPVERARAMVPILSPEITRAATHDAACDLDTDKLIQHYARTARGAGAQIRTGAKVTAVTRGKGHWRVEAAGETHEADILINGAGPWADIIAQMAGIAPIGLQPYRRSMARLPAPGGHDVSHWPMLMGPGESWYAKPDAGGWIVSPAEEDPCDPMDAWADDMVLAEGLARYQPYVTEEITRMTANWAGLRTFAPDRNLVIGEAADGFFWHAGQGGYGFQTAPAAAALLADLVLDRPPELAPNIVAGLSPQRF